MKIRQWRMKRVRREKEKRERNVCSMNGEKMFSSEIGREGEKHVSSEGGGGEEDDERKDEMSREEREEREREREDARAMR